MEFHIFVSYTTVSKLKLLSVCTHLLHPWSYTLDLRKFPVFTGKKFNNFNEWYNYGLKSWNLGVLRVYKPYSLPTYLPSLCVPSESDYTS